jgi:hypothetical protein
MWRFHRDDATADDVGCLGAKTAVKNLDEFVPIGVELDAALLLQDAAKVFEGVESLPAKISAHGILGCILSGVKGARF